MAISLDTSAISLLQENTQATYPITLTDAVYDLDGNTLTDRIDRSRRVVYVTLPYASWVLNDGWYEITVSAPDILESDNPLLVKAIHSTSAQIADIKAYDKAFGVVASAKEATTKNGSVYFKCYKRPAITLTVGLRGY